MDKKKARILVVDDEERTLRVVKDMLTPHGYEIIVARDGAEAVAAARSRQPDLILLDILMPKMDGYTACNTIKTDKKTNAIPVVMLTAVGYELNKELAQSLEADGYLTKPFKLQDLLGVIKQFLPAS